MPPGAGISYRTTRRPSFGLGTDWAFFCPRILLNHVVVNRANSSESMVGRIELTRPQGAAAHPELLIYGDIGGSWTGEESVAAKTVVEQLAGIRSDTITVRINSFGGSCADGLAIYNALRRHPAKITIAIDGVAASISSVIAMAGDRIEMAGNALMMIHAPWGHVVGNVGLLEEHADLLRRYEILIADAYAARTGDKPETMLALLREYKDHWFNAAEALQAGFIDAVVGSEGDEAGASAALLQLRKEPGFQRFAARVPDRFAAMLREAPHNTGASVARGNEMDQNNNASEISAAQRTEILAAERERCARIREFSSIRPAVAVLAERAISDGMSFEVFGQAALEIMGRDVTPCGGFVRTDGLSASRTSREGFVEAASDVLAIRAGIRLEKVHPGARDLSGMSIAALAEACLNRNDLARGSSPAATIRAALTTSDFPLILEDTIRKSLRKGYEDEPSTHTRWISRSTVPDFRPQSRVILGSMPELDRVYEGGEYTHGAIDEDKSVPFQVEKYGRIIAISWEALVNDDLGSLGRIPQGLGQAARRKEADLVYALFAGSGQLMQDGNALFHSAHANLATSSTVLDDVALAKGRLLMRKQTALGGGALNLAPRVLLVPAELESQAEKIIAASTIHAAKTGNTTSDGTDSPGIDALTPAWIRGLELVVESRLPAGAAYLLASSQQIDTAELAYLEEDGGPVVEEEAEFKRDVRAYKVRSVFAARFLDWRGAVKVPIA